MPTPTIKIYNTLTKKKDLLVPLRNNHINIFVCGPTVYDFSHIGHARTYVVFDAFVKYLQHLGYKTFYLQNITNVDDKIIIRARERKVPTKDLADAFEKEQIKDMKLQGITSVNKYARATDHTKEIISQVVRLKEKGYAYQIADGVYFDISKFKGYGKLSGRTVLQAEDSVSRIDYAKDKRNRGDFCLWKFSEEGNEWEPSWPSPFGKGRPGWHIEDTAITEKYFGPQYDIHGGGQDLLFPHHEAEVTQMEAISGKRPMAAYWMHTGFLTMSGQKMSKSLGNIVRINDFLKRYSAQELRFWIAKNLWHSPMDYSESIMVEVKMSLEKIEEFLRKVRAVKQLRSLQSWKEPLQNLQRTFYGELADDFNTPKAFATLFEFIRETNKALDEGLLGRKDAKHIYAFFEKINTIFGIIDTKKLRRSNVPAEVTQLVQQREASRKNQEWQKADELRAEIEKYGFLVDDTKDGPVVKKK